MHQKTKLQYKNVQVMYTSVISYLCYSWTILLCCFIYIFTNRQQPQVLTLMCILYCAHAILYFFLLLCKDNTMLFHILTNREQTQVLTLMCILTVHMQCMKLNPQRKLTELRHRKRFQLWPLVSGPAMPFSSIPQMKQKKARNNF